MTKPVSATRAGFDGFSRIWMHGEWLRGVLKHGNVSPLELPEADFSQQLLWYHPERKEPRLLWCNAEDQWFELQFTPIERP